MTLDELHVLERQLENWMCYTRSAKVKEAFYCFLFFSPNNKTLQKTSHVASVGFPTLQMRIMFQEIQQLQNKVSSKSCNYLSEQ